MMLGASKVRVARLDADGNVDGEWRDVGLATITTISDDGGVDCVALPESSPKWQTLTVEFDHVNWLVWSVLFGPPPLMRSKLWRRTTRIRRARQRSQR